MTLRHQHGLRCQLRLRLSVQLLVVTGTMDINIDPSCCRAMDPDLALGSSADSYVTMAPGGRAEHPHQVSSSPPGLLHLHLYAQHMNCSASLSLSVLHYIAPHHNGPHQLGP